MDDLQLRDEIRVPELGACVISTFNLNLQFFEQVLLPRLRSAGCRSVIVLVDEGQYVKALATEGYVPHLLGTAWVVAPVRTRGAFHPKFTLLLGKREGRLILGSHNLTFAGFGGNLENTTCWRSHGPSSERAAIQQVWRFVRHWTEDQPEALQELLKFMEAKNGWPWLTSGGDGEPWRVIGSSRSGPSLWDQVRPHLPKDVSGIIVLGPYFDMELVFLAELERSYPGAKITVGVQPGLTVLPVDAGQRRPRVRFHDLRSWPVLEKSLNDERESRFSRFVHAKCILFLDAKQDGVLISGSANPSAPAWFGDRGSRNAELITITPINSDTVLSLVKDLMAICDCPPLSSEAWQEIARARSSMGKENSGFSYIPVSAAWLAGRCLTLHLRTEVHFEITDVRIEDAQGNVTHPERWDEEPGLISIRLSDKISPASLRFVLCGDSETAPRIPIFNRDRLVEIATCTEAMISLKTALLGLDESLQGLEGNLKLIEKVILSHETVDHSSTHRTVLPKQDRASTESPIPLNAGSRVIPIHEFVQSRKPRQLTATDSLALIVDGLFYRLGQDLPDRDTRSELADVPEEDLGKVGQDPEKSEDQSPEDQDASEIRNQLFQRKAGSLGKRLTSLMDAILQKGDGCLARVQQAAAVLSVLRHFARLEAREKLAHRDADFLDIDQLVNLWSDLIDRLLPESSGMLWRAVQENDGQFFEEGSVLLSLLLWAAYATGVDLHTTLGAIDTEEEDLEPYLTLEARLAFMIMAAIDDEDAIRLSRATNDEPAFLRWLDDNIRKVGPIFSSVRNSSDISHQVVAPEPGRFVLFRNCEDWKAAIVVKPLGKKTRLWSLGFSKPKEFLTASLKGV